MDHINLIQMDNAEETGVETAHGLFNLPPLPLMPDVSGMEGLNVGEKVSLFFKEFGVTVDRRLVTLQKSAHTVDIESVRKALKDKGVLFVKNVGVEILTPEGYAPGFGNMTLQGQAVAGGVTIISSLSTEASRLYDWLKSIVVKGRIDKSFNWTVSDFEQTVAGAEGYLRMLKDNGRKVTYPLGKVYMNFDEFFAVGNAFNNVAKTIGARDIELIVKELAHAHEMGTLLVKKIKSNDIVLSDQGLRDIEFTVNRFVRLTNIAGAMSTLFNDFSAVLTQQGETFKKLG